MTEFHTETDSLGKAEVPADRLGDAQTQRTLQHFDIGRDSIPRETEVPRIVVIGGGAAARAVCPAAPDPPARQPRASRPVRHDPEGRLRNPSFHAGRTGCCAPREDKAHYTARS